MLETIAGIIDGKFASFTVQTTESLIVNNAHSA